MALSSCYDLAINLPNQNRYFRNIVEEMVEYTTSRIQITMVCASWIPLAIVRSSLKSDSAMGIPMRRKEFRQAQILVCNPGAGS